MRRQSSRSSRTLLAFAVPVIVLALFMISEPGLRVPGLPGLQARGQTVSPPLQEQLPPVAQPVWNGMEPLDTPYGVSVSDSRTLHMEVGEVQSTVVPPQVNPRCPDGRLLISDDGAKEPAAIALIDLDNLDGPPTLATFGLPPGWGNDRRILSNDHDLVALPNGQVLLVKMGQSIALLAPEPAWYDYAYKLTYNTDGSLHEAWGPGARSEILVWRSENCGSHFEFVSSMDTALLDDDYGSAEDGSGGLPQGDPYYGGPGSGTHPVYQMGGTDGILTRVDPKTGRVYVTIGLIGNLPETKAWGFGLGSDFLNRTVVMMSSNNGSTWDRAAALYLKPWRLDVVPRSNDMLAFGHSGGKIPAADEGLAFVIPACGIGCVVNPQAGGDAFEAPVMPGHFGWDQSPESHPVLYQKSPMEDMRINLLDRGILTRSPSSQQLLFAYLDTIDGKGDGYRLYAYDGWSSWQPLDPIVPESPNTGNFTLHLTPVDAGRGPLFFYWYDVNTQTKEATIRGKLVTRDSQETIAFAVSRSGAATRRFDVSTERRWYGDYHTAGGYATIEGWNNTYYYYPVWLEPDGNVRFARVKYEVPLAISPISAATLGYRVVSGSDTIILRQLADLLSLEPDPREEEEPRTILDPSGR